MTINIKIVDDDYANFVSPSAKTDELERCMEKTKLISGIADKDNPRIEKCKNCAGVGLYINGERMYPCKIWEILYETGLVYIVPSNSCRYSVVH